MCVGAKKSQVPIDVMKPELLVTKQEISLGVKGVAKTSASWGQRRLCSPLFHGKIKFNLLHK